MSHPSDVKIVIVDDESVILRHLEIALAVLNVELIFFSSGQAALDYFVRHDEINILVTDWMMREMDGPELITSVKALDNHQYLYTILLTGLCDTESLVTGFNIGADDYIQKPIVREEIVAKVSAGIRIQRIQDELRKTNELLSQKLRHIKNDLKSAAELCMTVLPDNYLTLDDVEMGVLFIPSEYVGGDLYGFKKITRDHLVFFQIDVSGHGIPSALYSFSLGQELLRAELFSDVIIQFEEIDVKPQVKHVDRAVEAINQSSLTKLKSDLYFTINYGALNTNTGIVRYCQAGHPPLILYSDKTGLATTYGKGGFPVGIMIDAVFEEQELQMHQNDRLFVFSDGICEAENDKGEFYGEQRLCRLIEQGREHNIRSLLDIIYKQVINWSNVEKLADDVTILGFQWTK